MSKFLELAEAYREGKIHASSPELKNLEGLISKMASTEDGRMEIAEVIGTYIQENFSKFDIAPLLTGQTKHFAYGQRPEFRLKRKGIKAYWIAPNSSTPKSRNYQDVLNMEFETLSVRPECLIEELRAGRVGTVQELMEDAQEALHNAIVEKIFTLLGQVYNETNNKERYVKDSTSLTQASLDKAIDTVAYRNGTQPVILGDRMLVNQILKFDGFTPEAKEEVRMNGSLGYYRGARIIAAYETYDEANDRNIVPTNRLYVTAGNLGYTATYGDVKTGQETSIEDWSWNARTDIEWGFVVTNPKALFVIEVE